jgi:Tfp pilus tip-associated adhesin PilY1
MKTRNAFLFLAVLAMAALPALAQVAHISDDREMFVGTGDVSKILPNIMILADNSGSMNTAIYHPAYHPRTDYRYDAEGHDLDLSETLDNLTGTGSIRYLGSTTTFHICRGEAQYHVIYDARGTYTQQLRNNPRRWRVNKGSGTFSTGQTIMYDGTGSGVNDRARITNVIDRGTYWEITVDTSTPGWGGNPDLNSYVYINYQIVVDYTDSTQAALHDIDEPCTGYTTQISNVKLYGNEDGGNDTRYDENYLYWLAFHASQQQINEVTYWADTGMFPNAAGTPVYYGYYRIQVERQVLADVVSDVYTTVNLGLTIFENGDNPDGGYVLEPMSNVSNLGAFLVHISGITADTWTPLSETMADIWYYYKGGTGGSYWPNGMGSGATNCGTGSDGAFPVSCPIQYTCQKNYVIIMTDGESTQDNWSNAEYSGSYFKSTPISTWGDADDHDNSNLTPNPDGFNADGTPYCPNNTCWGTNGSDLLDDMAYFMKNNDLFPDALYPDMPGDQSIETFVIGFNMDNDLLRDTAHNGNGEYYTASSYDTLKNALKDAITNILLRNFGFAAFTAPKKVTSTVGEGYSFIGYFLPSASSALWEGHLQSYMMTERWCRDTSGASGVLDGTDCDVSYESELKCKEGAATGVECLRTISLSASSQWDARDEMTLPRKIYTHDSSLSASPYALIEVNTANNATLMPLIGTDAAQTQTIIDALNSKMLSDLFHSDIAYVGPPMPGKKYLKNLNPPECGITSGLDKEDDPWCFEKLLKDQGFDPDVPNSGRQKVIYAGSNEGILHCVSALETRAKGGGKELWGFIPDEVLPSLKKIFIDNEYTFTVDGRATAEDILYRGATASWKTLLVFGLKDGGTSYYGLDVTSVPASNPTPVVLWKFPLKDTFTEYHGKSWSKPFIGKIRHLEGDSWIDRWVVVLAGGMAFNNGRDDDLAGKAVFVIDASTGQLIWQIGYSASGASDSTSTTHIDTVADSGYTGTDAHGMRYLTAKPEFNFPIPSAITPIDRDSDGYLDTIYFGNVAGHLFKSDISAIDPADWKTFQLYHKDLSTPQFQATVSNVSGITVTLNTNPGFDVHHNVYGLTSHAMATVDAVSNRTLTLGYMEGSPTFQTGEIIVVPSFAPIFLSPAVAFDPCYNLWVNFGTGDRVRSRTNPDSGLFVAVRDGTTTVSGVTAQKTGIRLSDLVPLSWTLDGTTWAMAETNIKVANKWGWYFNFPMASNHEKLFDPEPLVLPDMKLIPHVYFNTYQPPLASASEDCNAPKEGLMYFYDVTMDYCGTGTATGDMESGRIAGGGVFQGSDYIIYEGTGNVASIPPLQEIKPIKLIYTGGMLFMREKKR